MGISVFWHHVCEASRQSGHSLEDLLGEFRLLGISGVECSAEEVQTPGLGALLARAGMRVSSVYGFFEFGIHPDPESAIPFLDAASAAGSHRVMVIPGFVRDGSRPGDPSREAATERMIRTMAGLVPLASNRGLQICVEDFDDEASPLATHTGLRRFLDAVPELGCAFDTGNFRYSGVDELEAFHLLADRIVHLHCKDRSLKFLEGSECKQATDGTSLWSVATGSGDIAMEEIVSRLGARGYQGWYCIEHFGVSDYRSAIAASARWLASRGAAEGGME